MPLDTIKFITRFVLNPKSTGAVCPSSKKLSRKMAKSINKNATTGVIVELGAGTGAVTKEILYLGFDPKLLYSFELDSKLYSVLKNKFPHTNILNENAVSIDSFLAERNLIPCSFVSSLPLLSLPKDVVTEILTKVEDLLPSGGRFIQFTYNLNRKPSDLGFKKMRHINCSRVLINIPPARVDVFEKV